MAVRLEDIVNLCKRRAIIFPSGEIYGGYAGFFDYGPIGAEIRRKLINDWWEYFVVMRDDVYGVYPSIITAPKVWVASGHVDEFIDVLVECRNCRARYKAEALLEDAGVTIIDYSLEGISRLLEERKIRCPKCGGSLSEPKRFNLMIEAQVGAVSDGSVAYMRPEIAQGMFINFKLISIAMGARLPFGIAGMGKVFRNEISPRTFVFRCREFEIAEIEYFIDPDKQNECPYFSEVEKICVSIWSKEDQKAGKKPRELSIGDAFSEGIFSNEWHAYWCGKSLDWLSRIGISLQNLRLREHLETELAHYSKQTFDIEYKFPFLGWREIVGIANRTDYDLKRHSEFSGEKLYIVENGRKIYPHCIEPSFGIERVFLAILTEAFSRSSDGRIVLRLTPRVAPYDVAVFPLLKRKEFIEKASQINRMLKIEGFSTYVDFSGKIGRCYARADEIGIPYAVTVDHKTLEDDTVTIRFRDTRKQIRVAVRELPAKLRELIKQY